MEPTNRSHPIVYVCTHKLSFEGDDVQRALFAKETYNFNEPTNLSHPIVYVCTHKLSHERGLD